VQNPSIIKLADNSSVRIKTAQDDDQIILKHNDIIKKSTSKIMTRNKSFTFVRKPFYKLGFMIPEVSAAVEAANSLDATSQTGTNSSTASLNTAISTDASQLKAANTLDTTKYSAATSDNQDASNSKAANSSGTISNEAANSSDTISNEASNSSDAPSLKSDANLQDELGSKAAKSPTALATIDPNKKAANSLDAPSLRSANSSNAPSLSAHYSSVADSNEASKLSDKCKQESADKTTTEILEVESAGKNKEESVVENSSKYEKDFVLKLANVSLEEGRHYDGVRNPVLKSADLSLENGGKTKDAEKSAEDVHDIVEDYCNGAYEEDSSVKSGR
jgi:hypothetical protein